MLTQALLVDDNSRSVLNFLKRHLEADGLVQATTFLDPVEALACARDGLKAGEIPVAARVVAVADVFDALTTRRPYKEPMPLEAARNYLVENQRRQFDPACVEAAEIVEIATGRREGPFPKSGEASSIKGAVETGAPQDGSPEVTPAA
jgi:hypothetical protein